MSINLNSPAVKLRNEAVGIALGFTWMGTRKVLTAEQKARMAEAFGADKRNLSASKRLLDTADPAWKALTAIKSEVKAYWRDQTLPYVEDGVRLIRKDKLPGFMEWVAGKKAELAAAAAALDAKFPEMIEAARTGLNELFSANDYPGAVAGLFSVDAEPVATEPPEYLKTLSPALYEAQAARVAARFDEAVKLAEQAFTEELSKLVTNLAGALGGKNEDGKPKVFHASTVNNLTEFFDRFKALNVGGNAELEALVEQAKGVVSGKTTEDLRGDIGLRNTIAAQLSAVGSKLEGMMVAKPTRRILRTTTFDVMAAAAAKQDDPLAAIAETTNPTSANAEPGVPPSPAGAAEPAAA